MTKFMLKIVSSQVESRWNRNFDLEDKKHLNKFLFVSDVFTRESLFFVSRDSFVYLYREVYLNMLPSFEQKRNQTRDDWIKQQRQMSAE